MATISLKPHKSRIDFATYRGINQPIIVVIQESSNSGPYPEYKTLLEFNGRKFDNYQDAEAFCLSPYAQSVLKQTRKYYAKP